MAKDYKHRGQNRTRPTAKLGPWKIMAFFALPIALMIVSLYLFESPPFELNELEQPASIVQKPAETPKPADEENPVKPPPIFDFYTILPKQEVVVPEYEIKTRSREERMGQGKSVQYTLQAGSFKKLEETKPLRKKLTAMGIESRIEKTKVGDVSWYRVNIGPYSRVVSVDAIKHRLKQQGLDVIVTEIGR
jgi:cell division protein FtsN